ncbi:MAG TPA: hypothetical protein VNU46_09395 [Gemmatimonadaceae bacterium]|jgi:hypothetical protein|nr:hypothetical protein [Gemmatimonadaceae bacterium]
MLKFLIAGAMLAIAVAACKRTDQQGGVEVEKPVVGFQKDTIHTPTLGMETTTVKVPTVHTEDKQIVVPTIKKPQ